MTAQSPELALFGGAPAVPKTLRHFVHPQFDSLAEEAVRRQLHEAISIYDASGVYSRIEMAWSRLTGRDYVLSVNSGTNALLSMYFGLAMEPGSEVIVPAYNFFAAATPLFVLGMRPVLAECDDNGNLDIDRVKACIGPFTAAVCVTHLWGFPSRLSELQCLCERHRIALLEDASHAHGAEFDRMPVGTFGTAAAWSLQGKKIIAAGEGGFLATDSLDLFERAILLGHHNRRALAQVASPTLAPFAPTGLGMNLRMHPLGASLVEYQLSAFEKRRIELREVAQYLITELRKLDCLEVPTWPLGTQPSWYALPLKLCARDNQQVARERFVEALHAEGALEVDIPNTTRCLHRYHSFSPGTLLPLPSSSPARIGDPEGIPKAELYESRVFKMPVFYGDLRFKYADAYLEAFNKVAHSLFKLGI